MTDRGQSLIDSLQDMESSIMYMEKRISVSQVNRGTDRVLLRICQAVYKLLDKEIKRERPGND